MEAFHDPIRHLKYLRESLSQDNEPIGFFISAGCPLAVEMPSESYPLIPDVKGLSLAINEQLSTNTQYSSLLNELEKAEKNKENVEDILSFIRSLRMVSKGGTVRGFTEETLGELEKLICTAIVKKLDVQLSGQETPYHRLCNWIRSIDRKAAIEIFTTNYDMLMEQALEDLGVPYFDGFVGARRSFFDLRAIEDNLIPVHWSRLWKIHGSINWYQEKVDEENIVYRSSEIKTDASHLIYPSHLKYEESRKMPYLALIDQLNRFIRKKSSFLILSGYSFNDGHLNDTIMNALKANPTAMVLGLMYDTYKDKDGNNRYPEAYRLAKKQHNLNIWTFDRAIIGTNSGTWVKSHNQDDDEVDLQQFYHSTTTDDGPQCLVKLGDFSECTRFLQKIIGSPKGGPNA
ncbi:SIR2 family protein [Paremcibacter congregatus]|uniref:SIR2 family NAD-dependent protein deacylase n=1 Tax=Paremcibacter congregatus TaxID=2043170 RepID=UPI0030EF1998